MFSLAIHGGAGTLPRQQMDAAMETACRTALKAALMAGKQVLASGGSAMQAVSEAVCELENQELFNAGRGSVFNAAGHHHMDSSIMDGSNGQAGAVAAVQGIKNPVLLAKEVMLHSPHVLLSGEGAMEFAKLRNIPLADESYFFTTRRYYQYLLAKEQDEVLLDHAQYTSPKGTVGAVARDVHGNLAAATSTGGMTNKKFGRIGDTPIIGAGTYANNHTCAVSCTGHGEYFIRQVVAYDVHCLMEYKGLSLKEACEHVVLEKLKQTGGEGGLIAVDKKGNVCLPFNSEGMYRASLTEQGEFFGIY